MRRPGADVPAQLYGAPRADYVMVATRSLVGAWMPVWERLIRYRTLEPRAADTDVVVLDRRSAAEDGSVVELTLGSTSRARPLAAWTAGAHIRLRLPSGRTREYSLCGDPLDADSYRIAVRRLSDDGASAEVHALEIGDFVSASHPRNAFPLALPGHGSTARRLHFIAGGIGITPILPMIDAAERHGAPWTLTYLSRTAASKAYRDRLAVHADRVRLRTDDVDGFPDVARLVAEIEPDAAVYLCGPPALTDQLIARLKVADLGCEVHVERFGTPSITGHAFTVNLGSGGRSVQVGADESMLHAIAREVPSVSYSCRQGFCGSCKLKVVGAVRHADSILTDNERAAGFMLPCVSRAEGDSLSVEL